MQGSLRLAASLLQLTRLQVILIAGVAVLCSPLALHSQPIKRGAASHSKSQSDSSDLLLEIQRKRSANPEEMSIRDARVIASGRSMALSEVGAHAPKSLVIVRRLGKGPRSIEDKDATGLFPVPRSNSASPSSTAVEADHAAASTPPPTSGRAAELSKSPDRPMRAYSLSYSFSALAEQPDSHESKPVTFEAVVMVMKGLRYDASSSRFEAQIAVGLRNPEVPSDRALLGEPLPILVSANAADQVEPPKLEIKQLGEPEFVKISAAAPATPFYVSAGTIGDEGDRIEIPVERSQLSVQPVRAQIEGWGLSKTVIQIEVPGLAQSGKKYSIGVSTTKGEIVPTPVQLDDSGRATAELRSDGTGTATITAEGGPFQAGTATVRFISPRNFLIATLVGALAGWIARTRGRRWSLGELLVAIASASILAAAYAIGIHWLKWAPDAGVGEALAFFVAAMGAYSGMRALLYMEGRGGEAEA
jgi:hypothetical protein